MKNPIDEAFDYVQELEEENSNLNNIIANLTNNMKMDLCSDCYWSKRCAAYNDDMLISQKYKLEMLDCAERQEVKR